jgi:hypothetical protein
MTTVGDRRAETMSQDVYEAMEESRLKMVSLGKYNALKAQNDKIFGENRALKLA